MTVGAEADHLDTTGRTALHEAAARGFVQVSPPPRTNRTRRVLHPVLIGLAVVAALQAHDPAACRRVADEREACAPPAKRFPLSKCV